MKVAGMRKRQDGSFEQRFTVNGKRYSVYGKTQKACLVAADKKRLEIAEGVTNNKTVTLKKYTEQYFEQKRGTVKESTVYTERVALAPVLEAIGSMKVHKIDRQTVISVQRMLKDKGITPQGVNYRTGLLHAILKTACYDGLIRANPCEGVRRQRVTAKPARETIHRALTKQEQAAFLEAVKDSWNYELYLTALQTGMRLGELGALTWAAVDTSKNVIHVKQTETTDEDGKRTTGTPKTKTSLRDIPLSPEVRKVLVRQRAKVLARFGKCAPLYVFPAYNGGFLRPGTVDPEIKRAYESAGVPRFSFHAFRDTFATRAVESGMNMKTLQEVLGHASFAMTSDLYAHVLPDTKKQELLAVNFGL